MPSSSIHHVGNTSNNDRDQPIAQQEQHQNSQDEDQQRQQRKREWKEFLDHGQALREMDEERQQQEEENDATADSKTSDTMTKNRWYRLEGRELEPALRSGAIALVDAAWLVSFALNMTKEYDNATGTTGNTTSSSTTTSDATHGDNVNSNQSSDNNPPILPCRQELPNNAFLDCDQIMANCNANPNKMMQDYFHAKDDRLPILSLSYMWLSPAHCDPHGETLQCVAAWLQQRLLSELAARKTHPQQVLGLTLPQWGVFWDYASLHQHRPGRPRTTKEQALFSQGLHSLATFYSHPYTTCARLPEFPPYYPQGYDLPPQEGVMLVTNQAPYFQRGWPLFESSLTSMTKSSTLQQTLSYRPTRGRQQDDDDDKDPPTVIRRTPPPVPSQLNQKVQHVSFTNAKDDRPLVSRLYRDEFYRRFQSATELLYPKLDWNNDEILQVAQVLGEILLGGGSQQDEDEPTTTSQLQTLDLSGNRFDPVACEALGQVIVTAAAAGDDNNNNNNKAQQPIQKVLLNDNVNISDPGVQAMARALLHIRHVELCSIRLGRLGCEALATDHAPQTVRLRNLRLFNNPTLGEQGFSETFATFVVEHLEEVGLSSCRLGDDACQMLGEAAEALRIEDGKTPSLIHLDLSWNDDISLEGVQYLAQLARHCPRLESIRMEHSNQEFQDQTKQILHQAKDSLKVIFFEDEVLDMAKEMELAEKENAVEEEDGILDALEL